MAELFRRQDYKELLATVAEAQAGLGLNPGFILDHRLSLIEKKKTLP